MTNQVDVMANIFELPKKNRVKILKDIDSKFIEFVTGLLELNKIRDTLIPPAQEMVSFSFNELKEKKGYFLGGLTWAITLDPEDDPKIIKTTINKSYEGFVDLNQVLETVTYMCKQVNNLKIPEPEVLITEKTETGKKTYKLSREWINWYLVIFPGHRGIPAAAMRAIAKHFKQGPDDKIEYIVSELNINGLSESIGVKFLRITREYL